MLSLSIAKESRTTLISSIVMILVYKYWMVTFCVNFWDSFARHETCQCTIQHCLILKEIDETLQALWTVDSNLDTSFSNSGDNERGLYRCVFWLDCSKVDTIIVFGKHAKERFFVRLLHHLLLTLTCITYF